MNPSTHQHRQRSVPWPNTPQMREQRYRIRDFAGDVVEALNDHSADMSLAVGDVMPLVNDLLSETDLQGFGVTREGNHTPGSFWIYYDYELEIHLSTFKPRVPVPIHDHGTWEFIAPYVGEFSYTEFDRVDDASEEGIARLEPRLTRTLRPGDGAVAGPPPHDIHTFTPMSDVIWLLGMNQGPLARMRHYYDISAGTVEVRDSRAWRLGR